MPFHLHVSTLFNSVKGGPVLPPATLRLPPCRAEKDEVLEMEKKQEVPKWMLKHSVPLDQAFIANYEYFIPPNSCVEKCLKNNKNNFQTSTVDRNTLRASI